jgi:hypothetical protein
VESNRLLEFKKDHVLLKYRSVFALASRTCKLRFVKIRTLATLVAEIFCIIVQCPRG